MDAVILKIETNEKGMPEVHYTVTGRVAEPLAESADRFGESVYKAVGQEVFKAVHRALQEFKANV